MKQCLGCTELASTLCISLQLVFYLYVQRFIFQIKVSGLSFISHNSKLRLTSWLVAETSFEADACKGEDAADCVFPPFAHKVNDLTVNIDLRNPELWHFCRITVDSSSPADDKMSHGGGQGEVYSSRTGWGWWTNQHNKLKSSTWPRTMSQIQNLCCWYEGDLLCLQMDSKFHHHMSANTVFFLCRTRHPCFDCLLLLFYSCFFFFFFLSSWHYAHTYSHTHTLPAGALHVATHPVVLLGELEDGDLEVLGEPALGVRLAWRFDQRCIRMRQRSEKATCGTDLITDSSHWYIFMIVTSLFIKVGCAKPLKYDSTKLLSGFKVSPTSDLDDWCAFFQCRLPRLCLSFPHKAENEACGILALAFRFPVLYLEHISAVQKLHSRVSSRWHLLKQVHKLTREQQHDWASPLISCQAAWCRPN